MGLLVDVGESVDLAGVGAVTARRDDGHALLRH